MTKRVVVLGAGFAGLASVDVLARSRADLEIVIVDRHPYNTFQPLLYQVATAGLNPGDIAYPVRAFVRKHANVAFRKGVVADVDFDHRRVLLDEGSVRYDYLVIATGATTNFFGVDGAAEHSRAIYTMEDAVAVRDQLGAGLERAAAFGAREGELTVVLVGGGATGVEMAGTLAELRAAELRSTYREIDPAAARIVLVEQAGRLLAAFGDREAEYALRALRSRGVEVRLDTPVTSVGPDHITLGDGERLPCGMVIWSAGVSAGPLADRLDVAQGRGGRIAVDEHLRVAGRDEVFVVGDVALPHVDDGDTPLPQLAQPAIQEGRHAGRQILAMEAGAELTAFSYKDKGIMATIGRRAAVAQLSNGLRLRGTLAWGAWLGLHIVFLLGFRNRVAVLLNWAWRYVWWRRGNQVIAGP